MPAGGFLVDQSQINALKNKLKKVSGPDTPKTTSRDPKEYSDNHSISELHQKFQLKAKPSDTPDKHGKQCVFILSLTNDFCHLAMCNHGAVFSNRMCTHDCTYKRDQSLLILQ